MMGKGGEGIIEEGTHEELKAKKGGAYRKLVLSQLLCELPDKKEKVDLNEYLNEQLNV